MRFFFGRGSHAVLSFARARASSASSANLEALKTTPSASASVNDAEVAKFSRVGSDWWSAESTSGTGPLHAMNPARVDFIRRAISNHMGRSHLPASEQLHGVDILDIGCGGGLLAEALARLGARVVAIDPSEQNIAVAKAHSRVDVLTREISYKCTTVEELLALSTEEGSPPSFDFVCSLEVLEHVEDPKTFLRSCRKCAKPGGGLFLSTLNRTAKSYAMTILGAEYLLRLLPVGTHDWNKFIRPDELVSMVSSTGDVKSTIVEGLVLDPRCLSSGALSWRLSKTDLEVNYIVYAHLG